MNFKNCIQVLQQPRGAKMDHQEFKHFILFTYINEDVFKLQGCRTYCRRPCFQFIYYVCTIKLLDWQLLFQ